MTTGMDEFQRRMFEMEAVGEKRRQRQLLEMLLKERTVLMQIWPDRLEYLEGFERAISLISEEKPVD
jgi:hypothetical protein